MQNIDSGHRILKLDYYNPQIFQSCPATFLKRQGIIIQKKGDSNPKKWSKPRVKKNLGRNTIYRSNLHSVPEAKLGY